VLALIASAGLPEQGVAEAFGGFHVFEEEGRVIGAAGLERHGSFGLLRSVVVDPAARSRRAGAALVEAVLASAAEEGVASVYLLTTTAEHYFPRFGFERIARDEVPAEIVASTEFSAICPASAAVMVVRLLDGRSDTR
jgi:amino-acid N-acetyltransferase